ncbi:hypothetical protein ACWESM_18605 [Nocardia sp. NPDC003999]
MVLVKLTGRDGSVWHLTAGPSGHRGVRLDGRYAAPRPPRRLPGWLDELLVRIGHRLADLTGLGHRRP